MKFVFEGKQLRIEDFLQDMKNSEVMMNSIMALLLLLRAACHQRKETRGVDWIWALPACYAGHFYQVFLLFIVLGRSDGIQCVPLLEQEQNTKSSASALFAGFEECQTFGDHCKLVSWPSGGSCPGIVPLHQLQPLVVSQYQQTD